MPPKGNVQPPARRRGAQLENALLDASWDELVDNGYSKFTIESVAERAGTSRAVIYRRWQTKPELVLATISHISGRERIVVPDTGSLRGDVIEVLRRSNRARARLGIIIALQLADYFAETGSGLADLRSTMLADRTPALDTVVQRAIERGEADPAKLTPRVINAPLDLFRQELLITLKPVPDDVIESIVDEVFMPLVR